MLKRHRKSLKSVPNALKTARNYASFRQNETLFPRKWLVGDGLGLWWVPTIINSSPSQHLWPINSFGVRQTVVNTLPVSEIRPEPISGKIPGGITNYNTPADGLAPSRIVKPRRKPAHKKSVRVTPLPPPPKPTVRT